MELSIVAYGNQILRQQCIDTGLVMEIKYCKLLNALQ